MQVNPMKAASGRVGMLRFSAVQFLLFLGLFIVSAPFVEKLPNGTFLDGCILTAVLISGVLAVGRSRRILLVSVILVVPVVIARWAHEFQPNLPHGVFLVPALAFIIFLIGHLLFFILRAPRVNAEVLCAGLSAYLLLGLAWMFTYLLVAEVSPNSFGFTVGPDSSHVMTPFNAYYFSFITMTTVGYGDIVPLSDVARMLATVEAVTGTLFMAVMIARLVSLYAAHPPGEAAGKGKDGGRQNE